MKHTININVAGLTLIELMITLVILAILTSLAAPSMSTHFEKKRVIATAEDLYGILQKARSESIARSSEVYVKFNDTAPGATWQYGLSRNAGCNLAKTDPTEANANACVLIVDDGDGTLDDGTATIDSSDLILYRFTNVDYAGVSMNEASNTEITFDPKRGTASPATNIELESAAGYKIRLKVNILGRVRICSPSGAGYISGYNSASC